MRDAKKLPREEIFIFFPRSGWCEGACAEWRESPETYARSARRNPAPRTHDADTQRRCRCERRWRDFRGGRLSSLDFGKKTRGQNFQSLFVRVGVKKP